LDTKKSSCKIYDFVILIPHRDAITHLVKYRQKLFSLGYYGAFSFPLAAALARISGDLTRDELKKLAGNIRDRTRDNDGKITSTEYIKIQSEPFLFSGPGLDLFIDEQIFPESAKAKVLSAINPPVLCAALIDPENTPDIEKQIPEAAPLISFRAAALANLAISHLPGAAKKAGSEYSYEWEISAPVWLPAYR